ncbi:MAG: hypothetical protein CVV48_00530 [Spirochaetae bacterium HGW-Spirochaetae-4]|nr:MAG: hypothetical protein CVV48_00530 [Spirochaetae bacterium HGW-Spirochaetae-4]
MRMRKLAFLLVPILLITIVSCDGDIFGNLSDFMGQTGTNIYAENGLVTIDTSQGAAVVDATGSILDLEEPTAPVDPLNPTVDETAAIEAYEEAYEAEVETVKTTITEALTSPQKTEALVEALETPLTDPTDIPTKVTDVITEMETELGITIADPVTEGDLVTLILITDLYESAAPLVALLDDGDDTNDPTEEELLQLVSDALQVVDIVNTVSPTGAISLDDILSNLIDDPELLDQIMGRSSTTSRDVPPVEDGDDPMTFIEPIFATVINSIGTTGTGDTEVIISANLQSAVRSFAIIRSSYEQMAPAIAASGAELELTDVINYVLSVVFTEADAFFQTVPGSITFEQALNDVIFWMNQDATYQDTNKPAFVDAITDWEVEFEEYRALYPAKFGDDDTIPRTVGSIERTLDALIEALPGDNTLITDAIDDLFGTDEPTV